LQLQCAAGEQIEWSVVTHAHARTHAQEYDKSTTAELEEAYQACLGTLSVRLMTVRSCFFPFEVYWWC
jgi:hypothetical protein